MKQTNRQHEESGCTDYLQHSADSCPLLTATAAPEAPKLATLTEQENKYWICYFETYMNEIRRDAKRADAYAWKLICREFPRLKDFEGATP